MFWLISLFVVGFVGFLIGKKEMNSDSGLFCAMFAGLCWMLVCATAHTSFIKPEFSSENIKLISNEVIALDEHYQKIDKIGNIKFLLPVKDGKITREKEFVITSNLPEFEEIFSGEREDCYVVKSDKYKRSFFKLMSLMILSSTLEVLLIQFTFLCCLKVLQMNTTNFDKIYFFALEDIRI